MLFNSSPALSSFEDDELLTLELKVRPGADKVRLKPSIFL
jgi:hypothetical protein